MEKEIQNLKKTYCDGICRRCNILDIAQRRIGNRGYSWDKNYQSLGKELELERCPEGRRMQVELLNPATKHS